MTNEISERDLPTTEIGSGITATKAVNGYTVFRSGDRNLVSVQQFPGGKWVVIRAERGALTLHDTGAVMEAVMDMLGVSKVSVERAMISKVLWKDWD